ncbi:glycerol-3-phosphate dehydrogenase [Exophiala xenobiotica]|nr:glycerol-3-phosphate dehydrogenase [Exophiala xenobiotica]
MNPSNRTSNSVPAAKSSTETLTSTPQPATEGNQPSMTATPTRAADATSTNLSHSTSTNSTAPSLRTNTNESEKDLPPTKPSLFNHTPLIPAPSLASSRYNRQLLVPQLGLQGQQRLLAARVLIIGLGGLGCPAALYLAGAGVGTLGLMDGDVVEKSNLHRQIAHTEAAANNPKTTSKVESARDRCTQINSEVRYELYPTRATPDTLLDVLLNGTEKYDVVLDCTDNPATRYLVSDACVVSGTICVSGAAQRGEGSLVVLNNPPKPRRPGVSQQAQAEGQGQAQAQSQSQAEGKGPCYRCVFPRPPPPEMVRGCSEIGILGPVVGVIGTLMAGEAIKIIAAGQHLKSAPTDLSSSGAGTFTSGSTPTDRNETTHTKTTTTTTIKPPPRHTMLLYNTYASDPRSMFRTITLRGRRKDCLACGDDEALTKKGLTRITADTIAGEGRLDYQAFCGMADNDDVRLLDDERRIGAREFLEQLDSSSSSSTWMARKTGTGRPVVVDVREEHEYELGAKVPGSVNIPISRILRTGGRGGGVFDRLLTRLVETEPKVDNIEDQDDKEEEEEEEEQEPVPSASASVYFVCQRGNDSQIAAQKLIEYTTETEGAAEPTTEGAAEITTATTTKKTWGWIGDVKGGFLAMERFAHSQHQV